MSWKGFQRGVVRAPQSVRQRFNRGELTEDPIYQDAERRFQVLEKETVKLLEESGRWFDSINAMLTHQIFFSHIYQEIYTSIPDRLVETGSATPEPNAGGISACEYYRETVSKLQQAIAPELEMIETRIIQPTKDLLEIFKLVRKTIVKREHKKLDYDRHRASLKKLEDKRDRSAKEEKALSEAQRDADLATGEFEHYNNLLVQELPQMFKLEGAMIKPLFESLYYVQLTVYYSIHTHMQELQKLSYFDFASDVESGFRASQGNVQQQIESIGIARYRTLGGLRRPALKGSVSGQSHLGASSDSVTVGNQSSPLPSPLPPPPYTEKAGPSNVNSPFAQPNQTFSSNWPPSPASAASSAAAAAVKKKKPPPPVPPKKPKLPARPPAVERVTALYDFDGETAQDLPFRTGDVIEIVQRTGNSNEWWTGKLGGKTGSFPGNYVALNS